MSRIDLLREEIEQVGADEFCNRRIYQEDMPVKLMRILGRIALYDDWDIERLRGVECSMTERRLQVLALIADGLQDREIADRLGLSVETVKTHVRVVLGLLRARNRAHAVHLAHQQGVIE